MSTEEPPPPPSDTEEAPPPPSDTEEAPPPPSDDEEAPPPRFFVCSNCGHTHSSYTQLLWHIRDAHPGDLDAAAHAVLDRDAHRVADQQAEQPQRESAAREGLSTQTGAELSTARVSRLTALGFDVASVRAAIEACDGDVDRAEQLLGWMVEHHPAHPLCSSWRRERAATWSATDQRGEAKQLELWRKKGGGALEPVLESGAVALLDAQWIISHAKTGGVLSHRQALPKEAFVSLAHLIAATEYADCGLPVAALSYPWLTKDHPDPRGANLARVARALKALLSDSSTPRLGIFWDYGSLHQHPDPANGVMRTEGQNALFKQGLGCLGTLYSHPQTTVLRLTSFPDGHKAEDQAQGTNVAKYFDRGWCYTENCWASLTKDWTLSLDLGLMHDGKFYDSAAELIWDCVQDGGRRPPLLPSAFVAELESKSFTNGKDDKPLVSMLYKAAFEEQFGKATVLDYSGLGWGEAEAAQLAEVLASGAAPQLKMLDLQRNQIGDEGCKALAAALGKEGAALETLKLGGNKIDDEGCKALAAALCKEGAAPRLEKLYLSNTCNGIGDEGCKALAAALKEGAAPSLKTLVVGDLKDHLEVRWLQPELVAVCKTRGISLY